MWLRADGVPVAQAAKKFNEAKNIYIADYVAFHLTVTTNMAMIW